MKVIWHRLAQHDLHYIYSYTLQYGLQYTEKVLLRISFVAKFLAANPGMGVSKKDDDIREIIVSDTPYKIFYRLRKNKLEITEVEITQVFNTKQHPEKIRRHPKRHLEHDA